MLILTPSHDLQWEKEGSTYIRGNICLWLLHKALEQLPNPAGRQNLLWRGNFFAVLSL